MKSCSVVAFLLALLASAPVYSQEPMSVETARSHLAQAERLLKYTESRSEAEIRKDAALAEGEGPTFRESPLGRTLKNALFYSQLVLSSTVTDVEIRIRATGLHRWATKCLLRPKLDSLAAAFQQRLVEDREEFAYPLEDAGHLRMMVVRIPDRIFHGSQIDHIEIAEEVDLEYLTPTPNDPMSIGVPLVINIVDRLDSVGGSVNSRPVDSGEIQPVMRTIPVTAVLSVNYRLPHPWSLTVYDPRRTDKAVLDGRTYLLRRDLAATLALSVRRIEASKLGRRGLKETQLMMERAGIYFADPYQDAKEAVIFVHGLNSSPSIWGMLANMVMSRPELARRYRVGVAYYPTGISPERSAQMLADDLLRDKETLALERVVLVGHSMGGLVSRLLTSRRILEDGTVSREPALIDRLPFISKVVFVAAPFAGSPIADFTTSETIDGIVMKFLGSLEGIDALCEKGDFVKRMASLQPQVETHVVAGHSGRLFKDLTYTFGQLFFIRDMYGRKFPLACLPPAVLYVTPSDGVVPLTSALSVRGAKTTTLVPASHSDIVWWPETVEVVRKVLSE